MRVRFDYNQEDLVDAARRFLRRSKAGRSWRWQGALFLTLFYWLVIYVVFISLLHNPYLAVISAVVTALIIAALYPVWYERVVEKRLRRFYGERHSNNNAFQCEVELLPREIRIRDENTESFYEWNLIEEVVETPDSVDIFTRGGGVIVRNRAFESPTQREEFVALARSYLAAGQRGSVES